MSNVTIQGKLNTDRTKVKEMSVDANGSLHTTPISSEGVAPGFIGNAQKVAQASNYELIAAVTTAGVPGGDAGAVGDYLEAVIVKANTGTITILDGATEVLVIPASTAVGTRYEFNALAKTAWKITTPAATEAICIGNFT